MNDPERLRATKAAEFTLKVIDECYDPDMEHFDSVKHTAMVYALLADSALWVGETGFDAGAWLAEHDGMRIMDLVQAAYEKGRTALATAPAKPMQVRYCGHEAPLGKPCPICAPAPPIAEAGLREALELLLQRAAHTSACGMRCLPAEEWTKRRGNWVVDHCVCGIELGRAALRAIPDKSAPTGVPGFAGDPRDSK